MAGWLARKTPGKLTDKGKMSALVGAGRPSGIYCVFVAYLANMCVGLANQLIGHATFALPP